MRLVIISNMAHYRRPDVGIVGHGATAREIDALAELFDEVRHVACLHPEAAPRSAEPYRASNVELVPVPPAGGNQLEDKLGILRLTPSYVRTVHRELRHADAVHIRCPANISFYAVALLAGRRLPRRRWIKFAGNWMPRGREPLSYKAQRLWLAHLEHRAQVTVNGEWPDQAEHVHSFLNPCLTEDELARGQAAAATKRLAAPLRLLFVGHLGAAKNPRIAIESLRELVESGLDAQLDLAGGGAELEELRAHASQIGVGDRVTLHGGVARSELDRLYAQAHFVILPSRTEGWPKVLSEGLASGALPIASSVGSIPAMLSRFGAGRAIESLAPADYATAIRGYVADPTRWRAEIEHGLTAARLFSYRAYQDAVKRLLDLDAR